MEGEEEEEEEEEKKEACKKEEERKLNNLSNDSRQNTPKNCHSGIYLLLPNY